MVDVQDVVNAATIAQGAERLLARFNDVFGGPRQQLWDLARLQVNQAIEKRGGLRMNFAANKDSADGRVNWLPFYENPSIVESRRANYAKQNVFLRNEPVRLYTGSDARKFKVDIHYTLPHIASMVPTDMLLKMFSNDESLSNKDLENISQYLIDTVKYDINAPIDGLGQETIYDDNGNPMSRADLTPLKHAMEIMRNRLTDGSEGPVGKFFDQGNVDSAWNSLLMYMLDVTPAHTQISKIVMYAINMIRASVIGSAEFPVKGPPIVELKWGALYNFTPCIITDYRIQAIEEAGYDTKSLMAQRLKISLSLEEMRNIHGNFHGSPSVTGDLPGWDSILNLGSMDRSTKLVPPSPGTTGNWTPPNF